MAFTKLPLSNAPLAIIDGDRGENYPQKSEFATKGFCLFLSTSNVTSSGFAFGDLDFITAEKDAKLRKGKLQRHDVVLTTRGTVGNCAYFGDRIIYDHIRINSGMVILRADPERLNPYFLYSFLRSRIFKTQIETHSSGSAQPQLPISSLNNIVLPYFGIAEQRSIASVLGTFDTKIELNQRINVELEGMAKLMYDYWFVQFDFPMTAAQAAALGKPELAGQPYRVSGGKMTYNEILKREIPQGWGVCKVGDICDSVRDTVDPSAVDSATPYVGLEHVPRRRFFLDAWDTAKSVRSLKSSFACGDILFGKLRPYFHKVVKVGMNGICSSELLVLRARKSKYEALLGSIAFSDVFVESTSKQWGGAQMPRADWKRMERYVIPLPPDDLLERFNSFVLPLWKLGASNEKQNQELRELRDWLLPMLMNGQVSVG